MNNVVGLKWFPQRERKNELEIFSFFQKHFFGGKKTNQKDIKLLSLEAKIYILENRRQKLGLKNVSSSYATYDGAMIITGNQGQLHF